MTFKATGGVAPPGVEMEVDWPVPPLAALKVSATPSVPPGIVTGLTGAMEPALALLLVMVNITLVPPARA